MSVAILDALYDYIPTMHTDVGYNYDWQILKSKGNGSRATIVGAFCNVAFGADTIGNMEHQSMYPVIVPVTITAVVAYDVDIELDAHDYEVERAVQAVLDDFRRAFGLVPAGMVDAGVERFDYLGQATTDRLSGNDVNVVMNFRLEYFAERW